MLRAQPPIFDAGTDVGILRALIDCSPAAISRATGATRCDNAYLAETYLDDEESICTLGREMLQLLGFDVLIARDGGEALDNYRIQRDKIVCVILDMTIPNMDGEEALRALRRSDSEVRVLMSSGYNQQEVAQRFAGDDLTGFIQKTYQLYKLQAKLAEI